jgi:ATP-binding protein involved in chromosome partitioning
VENMRGLACPHCGETIEVFPAVADDRSIFREIDFLGSVPLDPSFARLNGVPEPFRALADRVAAAVA